MSPSNDKSLEALLQYLKRSRGFDFTGYKRSSLIRRVQKRMHALNVDSYQDYIDYLEVHPDEFTLLFDTILINVTGFFRDPEAWEYLRSTVIPDMLANKASDEPIRVWCAGVASGEEAYTVAMLLAEVIGKEEFRARVKIYATDIDEEALNQARQAVYTLKDVENIPHDLLNRYFERSGSHYTFDRELRRSVIFGRHDLIQDAPISRIDLLVCRNLLMYFNVETQAKVLARLHFALGDDGYLFLGKAEMLLSHPNLFVPAQLQRRVFNKIPSVNMRNRLMLMAQNGEEGNFTEPGTPTSLRDASLNYEPYAHLVIDIDRQLALANQKARSMFGISNRDIGRPFHELEVSYHPVELRSSIERVLKNHNSELVRDIEWHSGSNDTQFLEVQVVPLTARDDKDLLGASILFMDVTDHKKLQEELEVTNQEFETAMEEYQSTNEELETTNEELQSTIEELETTNEELQSTNEELETINEELQSTNQEMEVMNKELNERNQAYNRVNAFLESILSSLSSGVIVLDSELRVLIWNKAAEELWGLRGEEVQNQHFLGLDIGLPVEQLKIPIRSCLAEEQSQERVMLKARNRRGKEIQCRVTCTNLQDFNQDMDGVILLMEEIEKEQMAES